MENLYFDVVKFLNTITNAATCVCVIYIVSKFYNNPKIAELFPAVKSVVLRFALLSLGCGALSLSFFGSCPTIDQLAFNLGVSFLMVWVILFHRARFKKLIT